MAISPQGAKALTREDLAEVVRLETYIDDALKRGHRTFSFTALFKANADKVAIEIVSRYTAAGWAVTVDRGDGDFLKLSE